MSLTRQLVRLYPGSLRDRWGSDLEAEAQVEGWRSWPNLIVNILDMWLHPVVWPAKSSAQRRGRAAVMSIALALAGGFLADLLGEQGGLVAARGVRSWTAPLCDLLLLSGIVMVTPWPRPTMGALWTVLRQASRRLAVPALSVLARVHLGSASVPPVLRDLYAVPQSG